MRKIAVVLMLLIPSMLSAAPEMFLRGSVEASYLTNAFSDPLPVNASESYLEDIEFIKRWNIAPAITFDMFFGESHPTGLSLDMAVRFPVSAETIIHENGGYAGRNSLSDQKIGIFVGLGPVFRGQFGSVDIGVALRASVGSYDYFTSGVILGIETEPYINIEVTGNFYVSLGVKYNAHLMKFLDSSSSNIYEDGFMMMTAGGFVGLGVRFGGNDA